MKKDKLEKYIQIIREMMVTGTAGFSDQSARKGPVAGMGKVLGFRKRRNDDVDYRSVPKDYKKWVKDITSRNGRRS